MTNTQSATTPATVPAVYKVELEPYSSVRGPRTRVIDRETRQEWIAATREPFFATARLFATLGAADTDLLEVYRAGKATPDMAGTVGVARVLTVKESERLGPRIRRFQPHPLKGGAGIDAQADVAG